MFYLRDNFTGKLYGVYSSYRTAWQEAKKLLYRGVTCRIN